MSGLIPGVSILPAMGESCEIPAVKHFTLGDVCTLLILSGAGQSCSTEPVGYYGCVAVGNQSPGCHS